TTWPPPSRRSLLTEARSSSRSVQTRPRLPPASMIPPATLSACIRNPAGRHLPRRRSKHPGSVASRSRAAPNLRTTPLVLRPAHEQFGRILHGQRVVGGVIV